MATYSKTSYDVNDYESFRPTYPTEFFNTLLSYHGSKRDKLLDVGCGTGQVTFPMAPFFKESLGVDPSNTMITKCQSRKVDSVEFRLGKAEELDFVQSGTVDLLTAAEAVHWFDPAKFVSEASRVLAPNGTLAYWLYVEPIFQNPKMNEIYQKYVYKSPNYMGPLWDEGKSRYRDWLKEANELVCKSEKFEKVKIVKLDQESMSEDERKSALESGVPGGEKYLSIRKNLTLEQFMRYMKTYSAVHRWYLANEGSKGTDEDIILMMEREFRESGWEDEEVEVVWDSIYCFAKRTNDERSES